MAVRYAALSACRKVHVCHCNSLGGATWRSLTITGRTDRQTDRQSATQYAAPPREEGRIITINSISNGHGTCTKFIPSLISVSTPPPPLDVALSFLTMLKPGKLNRRLGLRSVSCRHNYYVVLYCTHCHMTFQLLQFPPKLDWAVEIELLQIDTHDVSKLRLFWFYLYKNCRHYFDIFSLL